MKLNIPIAFALMTAVCIGIAGMQLVESFVGGSQNPKKHYVSPYLNLRAHFCRQTGRTIKTRGWLTISTALRMLISLPLPRRESKPPGALT